MTHPRVVGTLQYAYGVPPAYWSVPLTRSKVLGHVMGPREVSAVRGGDVYRTVSAFVNVTLTWRYP